MLRLLLSSGGTREPIDEVRFISNVSTGGTGAALANAFLKQGHQVTLLRGHGSVPPHQDCHSELFSSAADLEERLRRQLADHPFDAVIMCAAVADYRPASFISGKIRSDADELLLRLVRNNKILPRIKSFQAPSPVVIGFKLTVGADLPAQEAAVQKQFEAGGVDAVVHNDLTEIQRSSLHPFKLFTSPSLATALHGTTELASALSTLIASLGSQR